MTDHRLWLGLLLGLTACSRQAPVKSYDLVVRVESDPGAPVAGVKLLHAGQSLGETGPDGRVVIRATGSEDSAWIWSWPVRPGTAPRRPL